MKSRHFWAAFASVGALLVLSSGASASTITVSQNTSTLPLSYFISTPLGGTSSTGFIQNTNQSIPDEQLSPWATSNSVVQTTNPYSVLNSAAAPQNSDAYAIYNQAVGTTSFSFLWGSPDSYNSVEFWSEVDGTGTLLATFTPGSVPTTSGATVTPGGDIPVATGSGFDYVTFMFSGDTIGSVELSDASTAAFEYDNVSTSGSMSETPLPGALPLFASGLLAMGLLGWRRKRSDLPVLPA